jgi:hypothetical protein
MYGGLPTKSASSKQQEPSALQDAKATRAVYLLYAVPFSAGQAKNEPKAAITTQKNIHTATSFREYTRERTTASF